MRPDRGDRRSGRGDVGAAGGRRARLHRAEPHRRDLRAVPDCSARLRTIIERGRDAASVRSAEAWRSMWTAQAPNARAPPGGQRGRVAGHARRRLRRPAVRVALLRAPGRRRLSAAGGRPPRWSRRCGRGARRLHALLLRPREVLTDDRSRRAGARRRRRRVPRHVHEAARPLRLPARQPARVVHDRRRAGERRAAPGVAIMGARARRRRGDRPASAGGSLRAERLVDARMQAAQSGCPRGEDATRAVAARRWCTSAGVTGYGS